MPRQTLDDIRAIPKEMLTAKDIAGFLGRSPYAITKQALEEPSKLGFRYVVAGKWPEFPKDAFIRYFEGPYVVYEALLTELEAIRAAIESLYTCMSAPPCAVRGDKEESA